MSSCRATNAKGTFGERWSLEAVKEHLGHSLRHEADLPYVVEVDGEVVARCARWAHAMWLVETLRSPKGRRSLERAEVLP